MEETIVRDAVTAKKLCTAFGIVPPAFLDGAPDEAYHSLLAIALSREFSRRPKLPQYNTIDDAVRLLHKSRNIIVLTGAGVGLYFENNSGVLEGNDVDRLPFRSRQVWVYRIFDLKIPVSIRSSNT